MDDEALRGYREQMAAQRALWPKGPWSDEPDRVEWTSHGFPCLIVRNSLGALCGYVAVPADHPAHGKHWASVPATAHRGLNYSRPCQTVICHAGADENVWWLGFDCIHIGFDEQADLAPGEFIFGMLDGSHARSFLRGGGPQYRTIAYVTGEVESLAEQLEAMKGTECRKP